MKTISVKLDNYLLDLLSHEAKEKQITRMEVIRSALLDFLLHKGDASDLAYIRAHQSDRLLSFEEVFP